MQNLSEFVDLWELISETKLSANVDRMQVLLDGFSSGAFWEQHSEQRHERPCHFTVVIEKHTCSSWQTLFYRVTKLSPLK